MMLVEGRTHQGISLKLGVQEFMKPSLEPLIVYFSTKSGNTRRFVEKLGIDAVCIPMKASEPLPNIERPYVLICPTYSGDKGQNAVPPQVIRFLNEEKNRTLLLGVIAGGNRNFGEYYGQAGKVIAYKCQVPHLYTFELMGTSDDVINVQKGIKELCQAPQQ